MTAEPVTACLLHADYHVMDRDCWDTTLNWYFEHSTLSATEQRTAYQGALERTILDGLREGS